MLFGFRSFVISLFVIASFMNAAQAKEFQPLETLAPTFATVLRGVDDLPAERRTVLDDATAAIQKSLGAGGEVALTFICTHNSRRSHLAQLWAQVAAEYFAVPGIKTYSGGIEVTACNIRTVRSLRRSGFQVVASSQSENPRYLVQFAEAMAPMAFYSKIYDKGDNPSDNFIAMMCCSDVDEKCPVVSGATARIPLHYIDPKVADDTAEEAATYDARSLQIASEMFYVFKQVAAIR